MILGALQPGDIPVLVLAVTGLVPLYVIARREVQGRPVLVPVRRPFRLGFGGLPLLWGGALFVLYALGGQLVISESLGVVGDAMGIVAALGGSLLVWWLARRMVLRPGGPGLRRAAQGLFHVWAALPFVFGSFLLLQLLGLPEKQQQVILIEERAEGWQALAIFAVVVAPVAEEVCFRGLLYPTLRQRLGARPALYLTSLCFAVIHWPMTTWMPLAFLAVFLAYLVEATGSLVPAVVAHAAFNALAVAQLLVFGG